MYQINFKQPARVHFIGIGGISMSGFAELLHSIGFKVSGSDSKESKITSHLEKIGIDIIYGQTTHNITSDIDFIVYTAAIQPDNEEFLAAQNLGIPMLDRAEMVGQVMKNYETAIAIAGTHGKTTTTSMVSHIFLAANLDPTISVGGILKAINGNLRIGASQNFITEACEYTNSFLKFYPTIGLILNIEEDHMDFFKDIDDIRSSFLRFAKRIPESGTLIINGDIDQLDYLIKDLSCKIVTYGIGKHTYDFTAANISYDEVGNASYDLVAQGAITDHISLHVVGIHNVLNSLASIALADSLSIPMEAIKEGLSSFSGTDRRFEYKGEVAGITIIDDYAHHPTEVEATLKAAKNQPHNMIWCVFQPHTYTRTKAFLKEFAVSLSYADKIVLSDIYAAREQDPGDISSKDLQNELITLGKETYYFPDFEEIETFLLEHCKQGDLILTMGAGDIVTVGESLLGK